MEKDFAYKYIANIAEQYNFVNYDIKIVALSSAGANYTSSLHKITVSEGNRDLHLFVKVAAMQKKMRSQLMKMYEIENIAYNTILKTFEKLQDDHQILQTDRLVFPKFYGYNNIECEEVLLLENLVVAGYGDHNRLKSIDWTYSEAVINELAKMHALGFAYSEYYPKEFNNIIEELQTKWEFDKIQWKQFFKSVVEKAVAVTHEVHKDKVKRFFEAMEQPPFYNNWGRRPVVGHGDFRPSNLMHRVQDDGTVDVKIIDLQTLQGSSPVVDLLYFIINGSDEKFRAQYYEKLVAHYYTELHKAMKRLHLDPEKVYSRADFDKELKEKLPLGLSMAVVVLPLVTVDVKNAPEISGETDMTVLAVENINDLYTSRLNGVVNDFVKWGILK